MSFLNCFRFDFSHDSSLFLEIDCVLYSLVAQVCVYIYIYIYICICMCVYIYISAGHRLIFLI